MLIKENPTSVNSTDIRLGDSRLSCSLTPKRSSLRAAANLADAPARVQLK